MPSVYKRLRMMKIPKFILREFPAVVFFIVDWQMSPGLSWEAPYCTTASCLRLVLAVVLFTVD